MARRDAADSGAMDERQSQIKARREALGLSVKRLAQMADVNRGAIAAWEKGQGSRTDTLGRVLRVLDELEAEAGMDAPPATAEARPEGLVRFEFDMPGEGNVHGFVEGPVSDSEELAEKVRAILRGSQSNDGELT
jgi:transcriptional regulator with XRE-family HTH domain